MDPSAHHNIHSRITHPKDGAELPLVREETIALNLPGLFGLRQTARCVGSTETAGCELEAFMAAVPSNGAGNRVETVSPTLELTAMLRRDSTTKHHVSVGSSCAD